MLLSDIEFPIFGLTNNHRKIWEEFNVLYIQTDSGTYILDNKNLEGNTLGIRRLKIPTSKLYIPRHMYENVSQMLHSNYRYFLDSTGKYFKWKKSKVVPLKYHKVIKVFHNDKDGYCVLHLKNINFPIKTNCRLAYEIQYVGILHSPDGYILYEYSDRIKSNTTRKI